MIGWVMLARVVEDRICTSTDGIDIGRAPEFEIRPRAEAIVWKSNATPGDADKARAHVEGDDEGWIVLTLDVAETDPIAAAKAIVMGGRS